MVCACGLVVWRVKYAMGVNPFLTSGWHADAKADGVGAGGAGGERVWCSKTCKTGQWPCCAAA